MDFKNMTFSAPLNVFLNLTNQCNLRCRYCSAQAGLDRSGADLSTAEWMDIFEQLRIAKVFNVILTGGEPFIREDIFDMLDVLCKNHGISINTNGIALSEDKVKRLKNYHIKDLLLSLDSDDPSVNDSLRGKGSYEKTMNAMKALRAYDISFGVLCTLTSRNSHTISTLADSLHELGVKKLSFNRVKCVGSAREDYGDLELTLEEEIEIVNQVESLKNKYPSFVQTNLCNYDNKKRISSDCESSGELDEGAKLLSCGVGREMCAITHDGWIIPCNNMDSIRCGSLMEDNLVNIWKNSAQLNMLRGIKQKNTKAIKQCEKCESSGLCGGGCRADAYNISGDIMGHDPYCWHLRRGIEKGL